MAYNLLHSTFGRSLEEGFPDPVLESNLNLDASLVDNSNLENQLYDDVENIEQALDRDSSKKPGARVDDNIEEGMNEKSVEEMDARADGKEMTIGVDATDESLNNSNLVPGEDAESLHIDRNENPDTADITDDGLEVDMNIVDPNKEDNVENSDP